MLLIQYFTNITNVKVFALSTESCTYPISHFQYPQWVMTLAVLYQISPRLSFLSSQNKHHANVAGKSTARAESLHSTNFHLLAGNYHLCLPTRLISCVKSHNQLSALAMNSGKIMTASKGYSRSIARIQPFPVLK